MKKLSFLFLLIVGLMVTITSCDEEETTPDAPSINPPTTIAVESGNDTEISFSINVPGGFQSATVANATKGTATVTSTPADGDQSGTITVTFSATETGAGSVTIQVTDQNGKTSQQQATVEIAEEITTVRITSNIDADTEWEAGKTYILATRVTVLDGVTLTIQPGTLIKGEAGTGANATALLVARGGTIMAEGKADAPIIFTSVADEITPEDIVAGDFASPNLDPDINGLWGGVIVLGKAPISASNDNDEDVSEVQIEGIPTSDPNGLYGGSITEDNSGVLKFISIRHGGTNIGAGNEINGLTLGGVGSATVVENIEIVSNQDDGIEWFGGTVNVTNALVWNTGDDAIDADQAWKGTLDNFLIVAPGDHNFELDGPEGSATGTYTIINGTVIANTDSDDDGEWDRTSSDLINVDDNTMVNMEDILFLNVAEGQLINESDDVQTLADAPDVSLTDIVIDIPSGEIADYVDGDVPSGVTAGTGGENAGADVSVFSWTWASQAGGLTGL